MTIRQAQFRQSLHLRKDLQMHHIELRLRDVQERQAFQRALREADRAAAMAAPSIRRQVGESIIRFGRRVAGESRRTPVWTG